MIRYIAILLLASCGVEDKHNKDCVLDGVDCHVGEDTDTEELPNDSGIPNQDWTGPRGAAGPQGNAGNDGSSCSVTQGIGSAEISCTDGTHAVISDGNNGNNGSDGIQGIQGLPGEDGDDAEIGVVDVCGDNPTKTDQVFFVIHNKVFTTSIKSGKPYISQVLPGSYITVDGTSCPYTVDADGLIAF